MSFVLRSAQVGFAGPRGGFIGMAGRTPNAEPPDNADGSPFGATFPYAASREGETADGALRSYSTLSP